MSTLRRGTVVVIPDFLDTRLERYGTRSQPVEINATGIVESTQVDGSFTVKYVGFDGKVRRCVIASSDDVIVLAHGADPTRDISKELVRLLPVIIAYLVAASRQTSVTTT